ncbi:MAG: DNA gyrase subunit B [Spirochaetia bacterium]|nr:DNA gyrase subunit B [Spirochaetia bacterium]
MWLGQNSLASVSQHFFVKQKSGYVIEHEEMEIIPAVWKCLDEACMNCIDEYRKNQSDPKLKPRDKMNLLEVSLSDDRKTVTVKDNGRGIPAANTEGVFMHLMYGENFDDLAQSDHVAGQNGVGISLVRMVSEFFKAVSSNNGVEYTRVFTVEEDFRRLLKTFGLSAEHAEEISLYFDEHGNVDGAPHLTDAQKAKCVALMTKNLMTAKTRKAAVTNHGLTVEFRLNPRYFNKLSVEFGLKLFRQYLQDLAMTNPGLTVIFHHKKKAETFLFKKGLEEIFAESDVPYYRLAYKNPKAASQIDLNAFVVIGQNKTLTWVNSNHAPLGGSPIEYLENRICDEVRKKPAIAALEKKLKTTSTRNDVRNCFHMYVDLRVLNPRFKSQDKSYLINDLNEEMRTAVDESLDKLLKKTGLMDEVKLQMERRTQLKALEDAEKGLRKARRDQIPKLISATGNAEDGEKLLFLAEGDSAIAGLRPARNPKLHGLFPLRGKPMNVKDMSLAKALANEEIKNIVAILGLPMKGHVKSAKELNYQKVSIITDADFDGYAIRSLLLSFFYEYWPELFSLGVVNITTAPLYEVEVEDAKKHKQILFCIDDAEYERIVKSLEKSGGRLIRKKRNKGLGESSIDAMKYAVNECLWEVRISSPKKSGTIQTLWFHKDMAEQRREAISQYTGSVYDDN